MLKINFILYSLSGISFLLNFPLWLEHAYLYLQVFVCTVYVQTYIKTSNGSLA